MRHNLPTKIGKGRSPALSPELLINMYVEQAPTGGKSQIVARGCPGSSLFTNLGTGLIRGLYKTLSDGALYCVLDQTLYSIASTGIATSLGTIGSSGRVFFADSGTELCIVAGAKGYTYNTTDGLAEITDVDFPGADSVTYLDGYFIFNNRSSGSKDQFFISSLLDGTMYDALDFATAERYPDNLVRVFADHSELLLFGTDSIEIWYNAGNADFPFARAQGSVIDDGLGAKHSVQKVDETVIWLNHEGIVRRLEGNTPVRISTHEIEYLISKGDWTNAFSWHYTMEGHQFYVLTVPSSTSLTTSGTYVYDAATQLWHQRKSYELDYLRMGFYAYAFNKHLAGDLLTGKIYELSLDLYEENGDHLISEMHFPQIEADGDRFIVHEFELDIEVGQKGKTLVSQEILYTAFNDLSATIFGTGATVHIGNTANGTSFSPVTSESITNSGHSAVFAYGLTTPKLILLTYNSGANMHCYGTSDSETWTELNANVLGGTAPASNGSTLMYSPDLGTGQGRLVHVGRNDSAYSDDGGANWTVSALGASYDNKNPTSGIWNPYDSTFYACGSALGSPDNGQILTSTDGINWSAEVERSGTQNWQHITYIADWEALVICGKESTSDERISHKPNGGSWTASSISGAVSLTEVSCIAYSPTLGIAIGISKTDNGGYVKASSIDSWERLDNGLNQTYTFVIWDPINELFIAGGTSGQLATFDGTTWTQRSLAGNDLQNLSITYMLATSRIVNAYAPTETFSEFSGDPQVMLRISSDTRTYGATQPTRSIGKKGEYRKRVIWRQLGQYRSFTPVVTISDPVSRAVFTSYVEVERCG